MNTLSLSEIQKIELELLIKFDKICRDNNLKYSLAYGTLIGAVRHKGFIPWDADVDVLMPRGDYERLIKLQYSDEVCELRHFSFTDKYGYEYAKLVDKKTLIDEPWRTDIKSGLFIDVFPMDFFSKKTKDKIFKRTTYLQLLSSSTVIKPFYYTRPHYIVRSFLKPFMLPFKKHLYSKIDNLCSKDSDGELTANIVHSEYHIPYTYSGEIWNNLIDYSFEDHTFLVFSDFEKVLQVQYGDYMTPPPVDYQKNVHGIKAYYLKDLKNE